MEQELQDQKKTLDKVSEQNQKNATFEQRLDALNLKIVPQNPEGTYTQSLVNGINKVPGLGTVAELVGYASRGVANLGHKIPYFGDKSKIKPNDFGDWDARKENMEKQTAILEPLAETGGLLKKIEGKYKDKNGVFKDDASKTEFAKSAVNILSRDDNQDLLEKYLEGKGVSPEIIKTTITDVNEAKHILLTGKGYEDFKPKNTKPEEKNKEFIEFLGYKTKAELELMGPKETNDCVEILGKDFGFTLGNDGKIEHTKPKTQSENYKKELKSANNINNKLKIEADKLDYSEQNTESEEQKVKEKAEKAANNQNYSRTSTNTPQSGMSAENMAGNAAVLGGAIASAAVIPFVGWIVALAILYSFKDKFKDDSEENKEFEKAAKSNGLKDEELQKLKDEVEQYKKGQHKDQPQLKNKIDELNTAGVGKVLKNTIQDSKSIQEQLPNIVTTENVGENNPPKGNTNIHTQQILQQNLRGANNGNENRIH